MLPGPLASASLPERLLCRLGFVRRARYTDRLAVSESLKARLDAAESAVDAQRERLAELQGRLNRANATVHDQIDALTSAEDALTELRGELAAAEQERASRATAAPCAAAPAEIEAARRTLREARHRVDVWDAVALLLDREAWGSFHAAGEPSLSDAQTKWHLGAASAAQSFKLLLGDIVAAPDDDESEPSPAP